MIRQLGTHLGKQIYFGFDHHLLPELEDYSRELAVFGLPVRAVDPNDLHYLTSAQRVCERVQGVPDAVGVLICSTGMGVSIAANKFPGIYAARCVSEEDAELSRTINNANVLCLAGRSGLALNRKVIHSFLTVPYEGRKLDRLQHIEVIEVQAAAAATPRARRPSAA